MTVLAFVFSLAIFASLFFFLMDVLFHGCRWYGDSTISIAPWRFLLAALLPLLIVKRALRKRSLDQSGATAALVVGFVLVLSNLCFFACLLTFFVAGSEATKFRSKRKKKLEENFKEGGQRNWVQVLCNGGVATQFAIIYMVDVGCVETAIDFSRNYNASWWCMAVLGALSCSCGDTLASEFGTAIGDSSPRLITTFRKVPKGTNGGVSFVGIISSIIGGAIIGLSFYVMLILKLHSEYVAVIPPQWLVIVVGAVAGLFGSLVDSVLGATLQFSGYSSEKECIVEKPSLGVTCISGFSFLDNHSVNLLSGLATALITPTFAFHIWGQFT